MRIEFNEKYLHIPQAELDRWESMAIEPKTKKLKYRRALIHEDDIFAIKELSLKESIIEFYDGGTMIVEGDYETIKKLIPERTEEDLEL
jgi:hypothetical protein